MVGISFKTDGRGAGAQRRVEHLRMASAVAWRCVSCLSFAGVNALVKGMKGGTLQVSGLKTLAAVAALLPWAVGHWWRHPKDLGLLRNPLFWVHAGLALAGTVLWVHGLRHTSLFHCVSASILSPVLTTLGAWLFLGERMTGLRIAAIILATSGGIIMSCGAKNPLVWTWSWSLLNGLSAPFLSTVCFVCANLSVKGLVPRHHPASISFAAIAVMAAGLLAVPASWGGMQVSWGAVAQLGALDWTMVAALGALTALGHVGLNQAIKRADLLFLLPLGALRILATVALGWIFFHERPVLADFAGTLVIFMAWILVSWQRPFPS
jgi:drug/metabolite transporter (DMT)-like permease